MGRACAAGALQRPVTLDILALILEVECLTLVL